MTDDPAALLTLDLGSATTTAACIARMGERWRLLAAHATPSVVPATAVRNRLLALIREADPALPADLGPDAGGLDGLRRLEVRSTPARRIVVVGATERAVRPFAATARLTGWRTTVATADRDDPVVLADRLLDPDVELVLAVSGEPAGADERGALPELASLVRAVGLRRPDLGLAFSGAIAREGSALELPAHRPGAVRTLPVGDDLRDELVALRAGRDDARVALARVAGTLAEVLDRRIEVLEIGLRGGLRVVARPSEPGEAAIVTSSFVATAGLLGDDAADGILDSIAGWSAVPMDRIRLADRIAELRESPWADPVGDGARIRLAAARAALGRLLAADPTAVDDPAPDLLILSGGVWAVAPAPAVTLAVADVVRRPGATQVVLDHARALAPLGVVEDAERRRSMVRDLAGDLLAPLAGLIVGGDSRPGRSIGRLRVHGPAGSTDVELQSGGLELVDLPPGETATLELDFHDRVGIPGRGRHLGVELAGGLAGLLVDLRGIPLRLPDRTDARRDVLAGWEAALWAGIER